MKWLLEGQLLPPQMNLENWIGVFRYIPRMSLKGKPDCRYAKTTCPVSVGLQPIYPCRSGLDKGKVRAVNARAMNKCWIHLRRWHIRRDNDTSVQPQPRLSGITQWGRLAENLGEVKFLWEGSTNLRRKNHETIKPKQKCGQKCAWLCHYICASDLRRTFCCMIISVERRLLFCLWKDYHRKKPTVSC